MKVPPMEEEKIRLIARDEEAHRMIVGIGSQRFAIDFHSGVTRLPPATADQPNTVLPLKPDAAPPNSHRDRFHNSCRELCRSA